MPTDNPSTARPGLSPDDVRTVVAEVSAPCHFFVGGSLRLEWRHVPVEELHWEMFHGRLLDATQTRQRQTFESWNIHQIGEGERSAEPLLSLKLDPVRQRIYVTRGIHSHVWAAYDSGDNVILSRPVRKWLRELTAEVEISRCRDPLALRHELAYRLHQAVVGVSRLPLTSVEAPLPAFTLGELAYFHQTTPAHDDARPMNSWLDLLSHGLNEQSSPGESARVLECLLRSTPAAALAAAAEAFATLWRRLGRAEEDWPALFLLIFNEAALSPWTNFVDQALAFLRCLEDRQRLRTGEQKVRGTGFQPVGQVENLSPGPVGQVENLSPRQNCPVVLSGAAHAEVLCRLLCLVARHLTAFDLEKFHQRGANYPDALLLDAVLKALLALIERSSSLFLAAEHDDEATTAAKRRRRRGLRQGWLLRCRYQGHPVPDAPTSPGENSRVLPAEFPHIADEQIVDPAQRGRRLFADEPWDAERLTACGRAVLRQSIADLRLPLELRELGTALYLDRPLGIYKRPTEPDRTPLLSYVAFSRTVAERRLHELFGLKLFPSAAELAACLQYLAELQVLALPLQSAPGMPRPGAPSLRDALQTAADFVFLNTTRRSVRDFLRLFDTRALQERCCLDWLQTGKRVLIVGGATPGTGPGTLLCHDAELRPRLEFEFEPQHGYHQSLAGEAPAQGLLLVRAWEPSEAGEMRALDVRSLNLRLWPR